MLLHAKLWRATADRLRTTHRVHLVQLAGFAGEPWTHGDGPFVQPVIDALATYVQAQGLERPAIIGHSMGGMSAIMLAQQHPELVGRVMSVDSLPFFSALFGPQVTVETARPFAEQAATSILDGFGRRFPDEPERNGHRHGAGPRDADGDGGMVAGLRSSGAGYGDPGRHDDRCCGPAWPA